MLLNILFGIKFKIQENYVFSMNGYSKLISEISNPHRIRLLFILSEHKAGLTELTKKIGEISHSEVSRHLGRLSKQGLIKKESVSGRKYEITSLGKTIISLFGPLDFIFHHFEYFKNHPLDDIPPLLLREIDALKDAEFTIGTGEVMIKMKEFIESSSKEIWIMCDNPFPFMPKAKKINFIIPPTILKYREKIYNKEIQFRVRILDQIPIAIGFSELGPGHLLLPSIIKSRPDYSIGLYITDPKGLGFLRKLWAYFWNQAEDYHHK